MDDIYLNHCRLFFVDRVIYARKAGEPVSAEVLEGEKIDLELASVSCVKSPVIYLKQSL